MRRKFLWHYLKITETILVIGWRHRKSVPYVHPFWSIVVTSVGEIIQRNVISLLHFTPRAVARVHLVQSISHIDIYKKLRHRRLVGNFRFWNVRSLVLLSSNKKCQMRQLVSRRNIYSWNPTKSSALKNMTLIKWSFIKTIKTLHLILSWLIQSR